MKCSVCGCDILPGSGWTMHITGERFCWDHRRTRPRNAPTAKETGLATLMDILSEASLPAPKPKREGVKRPGVTLALRGRKPGGEK